MVTKRKVLKEAAEFISIESVSTDSTRFSEMLKAVDYLTSKLSTLGFTVKIFKKKNHPPFIIAKRIISAERTTIGIYGHYDVQPEDPVKEWKSKPFKLDLRDRKLYGRGVADNKGHIIQNLAAIESLIHEKGLNNNLIMILEGEEETGSLYLEEFMALERDSLSEVDVFFITDTGMFAKRVFQIFYALRGLVYFEVQVKIGGRDLHSGIYGNSVLNPIQALADLFSKMKNIKTGEILIPGFYDSVRELDEKELELLKKTKISDKQLKSETNAFTVLSKKNIPAYLISKILPSMDVHGILGGYTQPGVKTVIPSTATAKFSFRIVENQKVEDVVKTVKTFIKKTLPAGVEYKLTLHGAEGYFYTTLDNEFVRKTSKIAEDHFGHEVVFNRSGGSIPAAEILQRLFEKPIILTGFTLSDDNIHSPNENFDEDMFWEGIEVLKKLYSSI